MKTKQTISLLCALFICFMFEQGLSAQDKKKSKETVKFYVEEMNCKNCRAKVEKNIAFEKGVTDLKCDLEMKMVEVTYKTDKTTPEKLIEAFSKIEMSAIPADSIRVEIPETESL